MNKKPLILIVDDNNANLQVLASIVSVKNYDIAVANSGEKALAFLESRLPDLILLDILMPGICGIQTCVQIKEKQEHADIPIIFLSAKNDEDSIIDGFKAGGVDYLTKPFRNLELLARLELHLELVSTKKKLLKLSVTDELTGIMNRRYFTDYIEKFIRNHLPQGEPATTILFDIDDFKHINDTLGHHIGDLALQNLSALCQKHIEDHHGIFARIGGDEFAFVLHSSDKEEVANFVKSFFEMIRNQSGNKEQMVPMFTISAGISEITNKDQSHTHVLAKVDKALYFSKIEGKNRFTYN